MAGVGESVRKAIDDWTAGDFEFAMLHACNAIDGTASKRYPALGSNARFTKLLREHYNVLGPMGIPGIDLVNTRWPVKVERPKASGGHPDLADVIPQGFTHIVIEEGKLRLSDRIIFGLLAVAVLAPENVGQKAPDGHFLKYASEVLLINQWWGRATDFAAVVARHPLPPEVLMDFNTWMP